MKKSQNLRRIMWERYVDASLNLKKNLSSIVRASILESSQQKGIECSIRGHRGPPTWDRFSLSPLGFRAFFTFLHDVAFSRWASNRNRDPWKPLAALGIIFRCASFSHVSPSRLLLRFSVFRADVPIFPTRAATLFENASFQVHREILFRFPLDEGSRGSVWFRELIPFLCSESGLLLVVCGYFHPSSNSDYA